MGDFSTSKTSAKKVDNTSSTTDPWGPQANYLTDIFNKAKGVYDQTSGNSFNGDQVAQFNPDQIDLFKNAINYAKTSPIAGLLQSQGQNLSPVGQGGVNTGFQGLTNFQPTGTTQGTIADAGLYADNPYISSMVDAATRDATRNVNENVLPGIGRDAALTGNTNSSKTAIRQGIADRGLQDLRGDTSANLRGQAYSQGLNLSQNQSQFNDTANLDRLKSLISGGLDTTAASRDALTGSLASQGSLFDIGNSGGAGLQAADQAKLDNALSKYQFNQQNPWGSLAQYFSIIGANNWGGSSSSSGVSNATGTITASPASTIGGILTGIGGIGGLFKPKTGG